MWGQQQGASAMGAAQGWLCCHCGRLVAGACSGARRFQVCFRIPVSRPATLALQVVEGEHQRGKRVMVFCTTLASCRAGGCVGCGWVVVVVVCVGGGGWAGLAG